RGRECDDGFPNEIGAGAAIGAEGDGANRRSTFNFQRPTSGELDGAGSGQAAMGEGDAMVLRALGKTGLKVTPISFGAFKIGSNEKTKYEQNYPLPSEEETSRLLNGVLDLGINLIDTAPAYGLSEQRIGRHI